MWRVEINLGTTAYDYLRYSIHHSVHIEKYCLTVLVPLIAVVKLLCSCIVCCVHTLSAGFPNEQALLAGV